MTKKDYELIAGVLAEQRARYTGEPCSELETLGNVARGIADRCGADNPRFDRARFLAACGVEG